MSKRTDFKFTKQYGKYSKDHVIKNMDRAQARSLQDVRKVGKITEPKKGKDLKPEVEISKLKKENEMLQKENDALKSKIEPKAVKPEANKAEPKAKARETK